MVKKLIFTYFLLLVSTAIFAQRTPTVFGQSRIQYKSFKWKKFETNNFEIYYHQGGKEIAKAVAKYAEKDHERIANLLGYYSFKKINIIVYNNIAYKKQSNIGLETNKYTTGTETKYLKNKIEVAFNTSLSELKEQVTKQITEVLITEMLYGNGMNQLIQSSYSVELPQWFTKGLIEFICKGWSIEMDNYMRIGKIPQSMSGANNFKNDDAKILGESIWNFIVMKHGKESIKHIINFARLSRDEKISITNTLGVEYKEFYRNYVNFYNKTSASAIENLTNVNDNPSLISYKYRKDVFSEIEVSPNGIKIAYTTNENGKTKIYVKDLETGKTKKIFKQGIKNRSFTDREQLPIIKWKNDKDLFVVYRGENEWSFFKDDKLVQISGNSLILRNLTGKGRRKYLKSYDQIQSFSFSEDGEQMLMSVIGDGRSDILLYMPKIKKTLKLTEDIYDDIDPVFLSEGVVVFASNRTLDDEGYDEGNLSEINNNYDIFRLDVFKKDDRITPITSSLSSEMKPRVVGEEVYYLSDKSGIKSLYKHNNQDSLSVLVAQYLQNINNYFANEKEVYLIPNEEKGSSISVLNIQDLESKEELRTERQKILDIKTSLHYKNDSEDTTSIIPKEKKKVSKPSSFPLSFSLDKMHSGARIDPLLGFGLIMDVTMKDIMENHSISGGIFALSDFASHNLYMGYNYIKRRVDFGLKYERENYQYNNSRSFTFLKFNSQKLRGSATLPFNYANKVTLNLGWVQTRWLTYNLTSLIQEDFVTDFANTSLSYTLDNTTKEGLNMLKGTRMKISIDNLAGLRTTDTTLTAASQESFRTIKLDLRNYTEIFKTITWANRLSLGTSRGNAPKTFIFGGMDNWFGPKSDLNETPPVRYTSDVLYLDYITSVRGFNYNVRNGNNFVLLNSELRLPYKKLTSFSTYKSNLVENLQFVFFSDLGTAWTGNNPTSRENSINKTTVGGSGKPYSISVYNYRSPLILGFGGGVRTVVLGTYAKLDVAWGVEDLKVRGPKLYLTLGYDF